MKKVFIVIPTIRNLDFLKEWKKQFSDIEIIVCEDHPKKEIQIPKVGKKIYHYSWKEIDKDLGKNGWIIPRKVSGIRNYGFLKAFQMGANIIITIDDDCYPVKNHNFIEQHLQNLSISVPQRWVNTYPDSRQLYTRGMRYFNRTEQRVLVSHGLWTNILDFDGATHLQNLEFKAEFSEHFLQIIPHGAYYPMCSMNLAFDAKITPIMYFPLMGEDTKGNKWGYDRFDDIWAGIFSKKILDHLGGSVINGAPFVKHNKASDPFKNLQKEALGIEANEELWKLVDQVQLTSSSPAECYLELANKIKWPKEAYFSKDLKKAMNIWASFFKH